MPTPTWTVFVVVIHHIMVVVMDGHHITIFIVSVMVMVVVNHAFIAIIFDFLDAITFTSIMGLDWVCKETHT